MGAAAELWGDTLATVRFLKVLWLQHLRLWNEEGVD